MRKRRTCDRCYKIKARCVYDNTSESCARCFRLGHECNGKRPLQQLGRVNAPVHDDRDVDESSSLIHIGQIVMLKQPSAWPQSLTQDDLVCIDFLLQPAQIAGLLYGSTFQDSMRSAMAGPIFIATDQLKDGYVALASAISEMKKTSLNQSVQIPHTWRGSKAVQVLRNFKSSSIQDARIALSLALVLVTYNDLNIGGPSLPIARSALLQAQPFWRRLACSGAQEADPHMICLLFCEVFECLVVGQIPVFRYEAPTRDKGLDRYYGVCHDLLPYLYDICLLYKSIKEQKLSTAEIAARTRQLNAHVEQWIPLTVVTERTKMLQDHAERQHFLGQAKSFKCAVELLLIQTQRSPGMDLLARAKAIQLEEYIIHARQSGTGKPKYLLFPYFLACIELYDAQEDHNEDVLNTMHDISNGNAPKACEAMVAALIYIWRSKQQIPRLTWFQCIDENLQIGMGP